MSEICENCRSSLYKATIANQCIHCGYRNQPITHRILDRLIWFCATNVLVWLAIVFKAAKVDVRIGLFASAMTAFCFFGGLLLRLWLKGMGDWIAAGLTILLGVSLFRYVGL